jgi:hypothetical protein
MTNLGTLFPPDFLLHQCGQFGHLGSAAGSHRSPAAWGPWAEWGEELALTLMVLVLLLGTSAWSVAKILKARGVTLERPVGLRFTLWRD